MKIEIGITSEELSARRERLMKAKRLDEPDRVPVLPYVNSRYWLRKIGLTFKEYFSSPRAMFEAQLNGQKWLLENIKCDKHEILFVPEFLFVEDPSALGAKVVFPDDDIPWMKRPHLLQMEEDIEIVRRADPVRGGLHGRQLEWYDEMKRIASEYEVRLSDGAAVDLTGCVRLHCGGFGGTSWVATDLRGAEQFNVDLYERPEWAKQLLDLVADKTIEWIEHHREYCGGDAYILNESRTNEIFIGDDATALMSPRHYAEFGLPPLKKVAGHFRDRHGLRIIAHNCGRVDHLIEQIAEELRPDEYWGFSYLTDKRLIERCMAGRTVLSGGISPVTIFEGRPDQVKREAREAIEIFAPHRGYILMDGNNIAPESPVENINALYEAAVEFGRYGG